MKDVLHHVHSIHHHLKRHHKKYLLGMFGGFAVVKTVLLLFTGLGITQISHPIFADNQTTCTLTGQYYAGAYQEGCYMTGGYWTGGSQVCTETVPGYWTGGTLDESGNLTGQTYIEPEQSCTLTGQYYTGAYQAGCYMTGGYWTGGSQICVSTPSLSTSGAYGQCAAGDVSLISPLSGSFSTGLLSVQWQYPNGDCSSGTALYLDIWESNQQRIRLSGFASNSTGLVVNLAGLAGTYSSSGVLLSGFYHVLGTGLSGQQIYLFTGMYTGHYTNFWTGYRVRLTDTQGHTLATSTPFVVDTLFPSLTGMQITSSQLSSGYIPLGATIQFSFLANEELTGLDVRIGGQSGTFLQKSGLLYTYTQTFTSGFAFGPIPYALYYSDLAGNTGMVSGISTLVFDKYLPSLSYLNFTSYAGLSGSVDLNFTVTEPAISTFRYLLSGGQVGSRSTTGYQTAHRYVFSGVTLGTVYAYRISLTDVAGNPSLYQGNFWVTSTGVQFAQAIVASDLTGTLSHLSLILRDEVEKFTVCKQSLIYTAIPLQIGRNTYTLHMPQFKKSDVKQIVNAFSLIVLNKVEKNTELSSTEINDITKKFDDFLIVLKLMRDDDNTCKQNLSNYHINQFKMMLSEYGLYL